jgi:putative Mg2+ transporter-C (MgtC) family protein
MSIAADAMSNKIKNQPGQTKGFNTAASGGVEWNQRVRSITSDDVVMCILGITFTVFSVSILLGELLFLPRDPLNWCSAARIEAAGYDVRKQYANPDANTDPCYFERTVYLLGWNRFECDFARRMIYAVILGACVGYERRAVDRPAGLRTMSLVSLGSAIFTMASQFAFRSSTQSWDAARVSAAIPSGVGFLGSALIWKETIGEREHRRNHVHGITTATTVWLSASVGIGAGGALWVTSAWTVILVIFVLRLGPQLVFVEDMSLQGSRCLTSEGDWDVDSKDDSDHDDDDDEADNKEREEEKIAYNIFNAFKNETMKGSDQSVATLVKGTTGIPDTHTKRGISAVRQSIQQQKKQAVNFHGD